jgi:hypothetical protein
MKNSVEDMNQLSETKPTSRVSFLLPVLTSTRPASKQERISGGQFFIPESIATQRQSDKTFYPCNQGPRSLGRPKVRILNYLRFLWAYPPERANRPFPYVVPGRTKRSLDGHVYLIKEGKSSHGTNLGGRDLQRSSGSENSL